MTEKIITCITCPVGCDITVKGEGDNITELKGNDCKRGETYARNEFISPVRILTSTVKVQGNKGPRLVAVRSSAPVPKSKLIDCMQVIRGVSAKAPVQFMDVVVPDILGTGVDIVATGEEL